MSEEEKKDDPRRETCLSFAFVTANPSPGVIEEHIRETLRMMGRTLRPGDDHYVEVREHGRTQPMDRTRTWHVQVNVTTHDDWAEL